MSRHWSMTRWTPSPCHRRRSRTTSSTEPKRKLWARQSASCSGTRCEPLAAPRQPRGDLGPGTADDDGHHERQADLRRIAAGGPAVAGQDLSLPRILVEGHARHVPLVGRTPRRPASCGALRARRRSGSRRSGAGSSARRPAGSRADPGSPACRARARESRAPRTPGGPCARGATGRECRTSGAPSRSSPRRCRGRGGRRPAGRSPPLAWPGARGGRT